MSISHFARIKCSDCGKWFQTSMDAAKRKSIDCKSCGTSLNRQVLQRKHHLKYRLQVRGEGGCKSETFPTIAAMDKFKADNWAKIQDGSLNLNHDQLLKATVGSIIQLFIDEKAPIKYKGGKSGHGYEYAIGKLRRINRHEIASIPLKKLTPNDVINFINKMRTEKGDRIDKDGNDDGKITRKDGKRMRIGSSDSTVGHHVNLIKVALDHYTIKHKLDIANAVLGITALGEKRPKTDSKKREKRLTRNEETLILETLKTEEQRSSIIFLIETGLRLGEFFRVEDRDIDYDERQIYLGETKNGEKRYALITERASTALDILKAKNGFPLYSKTPAMLYRSFKNAVRKLQLHDELTIHSLRHEFCSRCVEEGGLTFRELMSLSGHEDIKSVARYVKSDFNTAKKKMLKSRNK